MNHNPAFLLRSLISAALHDYLKELPRLHKQCEGLRKRLAELDLCNDPQLLAKLTEGYVHNAHACVF